MSSLPARTSPTRLPQSVRSSSSSDGDDRSRSREALAAELELDRSDCRIGLHLRETSTMLEATASLFGADADGELAIKVEDEVLLFYVVDARGRRHATRHLELPFAVEPSAVRLWLTGRGIRIAVPKRPPPPSAASPGSGPVPDATPAAPVQERGLPARRISEPA